MVFEKKIVIFLMCFFGIFSHKRLFCDILDSKEWFLHRNSKVWKKFKKLKICKRVTPWFLSKNRPFSHMCVFFGKSSNKRSFFDNLDGKECSLDRNSKVWKSSKNGKFASGLRHSFCQKIAFFSCVFLLGNLAIKDRFLIFWMEKNAF